MHIVMTLVLSILNIKTEMFLHRTFKIFVTLLLVCSLFFITMYKDYNYIFEFYRFLIIDNLNVSIDFTIFATIMSIQLLFSDDIGTDKINGFGKWLFLCYFFSLTLTTSIFIQTICLFIVWFFYCYFFEKKQLVLEKLIIHCNLLLVFIVYENIFIKYTFFINNIIYILSFIVLVLHTNRTLSSSFKNTSLMMLICFMLYLKGLYVFIQPNLFVVLTTILFSLFPIIYKKWNSEGVFVEILFIFWMLGVVTTLSFGFLLMGSFTWFKSKSITKDPNLLTNYNFVSNILHLLPIIIIPMIMLVSDISLLYLRVIFFIYGIYLFAFINKSADSFLLNYKNEKIETFGVLSFVIGIIVFMVNGL